MVKALQRFLGFTNLYCRFIRRFSSVAAHLTDLLKNKRTKNLSFNPKARQALAEHKQHFASVPILKLPDPDKSLVVEVDASEVGLGAVTKTW